MGEAEQGQAPGQGQGPAATRSQPAEPVPAATAPSFELSRVRELVLQAHPNVVPELVQGTTFDELIASIEPAEAAFQRIRESVAGQQSLPGGQVPPPASAGAPGRTFVINVEELSPGQKIAEGLKRAKQQPRA